MGSAQQVKRAALITAHAEGISVEVFERVLLRAFRQALGRRTGIYALYDKRRPYYVGLASSLRSRIKDHTSDHLSGKWDRFSFFEVKKKKYLKDVESLAIRIANPVANKARPDFCSHHNIKRKVIRDMLIVVKKGVYGG